MRRLLMLSLLAAVLLTPHLTYAQVGSIAGTVRDTSGAALPGVTVEVTSPALIEKVRSSTTDGSGRYQIVALPVGTYTITFRLEGFSIARRENIQLTSDFSAPVNVQLAVGNVSETVDVVGQPPLVDVLNARVQQTFQGAEVAELPTQRDISSLLNLVPSLTANPLGGICSGGVGIFCNPTGPAFNSHTSALDSDGQNQGRILVDGMSINRGASAAGFSVNANTGITNGLVIDTANVQEVTFTLSGALGESETGGSSINIVPRTGGNRFAGNYFTSYTGTRFFDRNRGTHLSDTPDTQEYVKDYDVTGAFGGPILRDRLWFYAQARKRGNEQYPNGGTQPGFENLNLGNFGDNYVPNRERGWLTFKNEYKNASVRLTLQASQKNKFNIYWDEQDACTNPCYGMINIVDSPESYFSLQNRPNRLQQVSWTNPLTNRFLLEAGLSIVATHQDSTRARDYPNLRSIPRVCESGPTVGRDGEAIKVNAAITNNINSPGTCSVFNTMVSGSINDVFPGGLQTLTNDDQYRSRATASYITGSHNAKIGYDGVYFSQKVRNEVNDLRLTYHYATPPTTGTANCLAAAAQAANPYACGNMALWHPEDLYNTGLLRPRPVGFQMNTGVGTTDERVWFGAIYLQDQWTLNRFTINGALRYDHAESRYGETCIGPDVFVPVQEDGTNFWCSTPSKGVRYNDITPRWGVAWDVFGSGKTSVKWNMGKYLQAAGFGGLYTDNNPARRSTNVMTRAWDDLNGNRIVECNFADPAPHTHPSGDVCGSMLQGGGPNAGQPTTQFQQFGRPPNPSQLFAADSFCGRTENSSELHAQYCDAAGQNLMAGWDTRRNEWQMGLGVQHEILPRLSGEVTYNYRKYSNLTDADTLGRGCDYYLGSDPQACFNGYNAFQSGNNYDFYSVQAPLDPRLPNGGGYVIRGLDNQSTQGGLPDGGDVTTIRDELSYSWNGVDTNFVFRGARGLRVSGGTSTGRSLRNTCGTDGDNPNVKGREGNLYGGGCRVDNPFETNIRANASYTIPWVDVLVGTVYQFRPGAQRSANLEISNLDVNWEPTAAARATAPCDTNGAAAGGQTVGCFFTGGGNPVVTQTVNLLDTGDLYLPGISLWDLNFQKVIRFAGKRLNFGVNVYNLFNSDTITGRDNTYTAFRLPDGTWVADNPNTPDVEVNEWGNVTNIVSPRFMRFSVEFQF